ncbi:MAG: hypothetical protein MI866_12770 [Bacteroidales bacterium]|nr:hypothetical protein [Bacteroidales bacterium]
MNLKAIAICCFLVLYCLNFKAQEAKGKNVESLVRDTISLSADTVAGVPVFLGDEPQLIDTTRNDTADIAIDISTVTDTIQAEQETSTTVIKGYSPFTNYTDTFNVGTPVLDTLDKAKVNMQLQKRLARLNDTSNIRTTGNFIHENSIAYSKTSLTDLWYSYINTTYSDSKSDTTQNLFAEKSNVSTNKVTVQENPELLQTTGKETSEKQELASALSSSTKNTESGKKAIDANNVVFYIQIAAARSELSTAEIKNVNKTKAEYRVQNENNWFKYQVSLGSDYISARQAINDYPGKQVFLVAYKGNKRLDLWETVKHIELQTPKQDELLFVVQVAASRHLLSEKEKSQLVSPGDNLRIIKEDDWHKYQIIIGSSYQLTLKKCKLIGINKSFPVAYFNGEKIEMAKAIKMTITNN